MNFNLSQAEQLKFQESRFDHSPQNYNGLNLIVFIRGGTRRMGPFKIQIANTQP